MKISEHTKKEIKQQLIGILKELTIIKINCDPVTETTRRVAKHRVG